MEVDIPKGPYAAFWLGVTLLGIENGGDAVVGLEVLKREVISVLKRKINLPFEFVDWELLFYKALTLAVVTYDITRGPVATYVVWKARSVAQHLARSKREHSKHEIQFTDLLDEDGNNPIEETVGQYDRYNELSTKWKELLLGLDYMHFKTVKVMAEHSYGELIVLMYDGKTREEIAEFFGVSLVALRKGVKELRDFVEMLGVKREI